MSIVNVYEPRLQSIFMEGFHAAMTAGTVLVACGWMLMLSRGKAPMGDKPNVNLRLKKTACRALRLDFPLKIKET